MSDYYSLAVVRHLYLPTREKFTPCGTQEAIQADPRRFRARSVKGFCGQSKSAMGW
jgi:hypothetical protein